METHPYPQDREHPSPHASSPNTSSTSSSSSSSNGALPAPSPRAPPPPPPPPLTPKSTPRSDANPYPTTFIQADTNSFKHVVQMLTGSAETAAKHAAAPPKSPILPAARPPGPKKPSFKLYERRGSFRHLKMINPLLPTIVGHHPGFSPRKQAEILSPSTLDLPSLVLSPVTPLIPDPFNRSSSPAVSAEDRAIAEKGFYLHPSPRGSSTPRDADPPRLLPLFPVTSPRLSSASP